MDNLKYWNMIGLCCFWLGLTGCGGGVIRPEPQLLQQVQGQPYSDADFVAVLRNHVRYGLVDYETLQQNPDPLLRYCALLSDTGPDSTPDSFQDPAEVTAYYINAFNALVLRAVLLQDVPVTMYDLSMPRLEHDYRFPVDGRVINLAELEERMMQQSNGDIRILFATSRAAMGTPRLRNEPYRGPALERQLTASAAEALALTEILRIDHAERKILVWQLILDREDQFVEYWKSRRRVQNAYLFNVLLELSSPERRRSLQGAVGYEFRPIAFDRTLNRWESRPRRPLVP